VWYKWGLVAAESDNRQPLAKNVLGIVLLVVVLVVAVGVGLFFLLRNDNNKKGNGPGGVGHYKPYTARFLSSSGLGAQSLVMGQQFYWAGPKRGYRYEFRRTVDGYVYVRYLPKSVSLGAAGDYLDIATYPFTQAVNGLKLEAHKKHATVTNAPGGGVIYVDPHRPRTVYLAFPGVNAQIEIFGQSPVQAVTLARSGKIRPVS
jgi:hypothetical protein